VDETLSELQRKVGMTRRRLEDAARRLAALRERLSRREQPGEAAQPLFQELAGTGGGLDDVELHFQALDTEDPTREKR
jgi:hypothetical protein